MRQWTVGVACRKPRQFGSWNRTPRRLGVEELESRDLLAIGLVNWLSPPQHLGALVPESSAASEAENSPQLSTLRRSSGRFSSAPQTSVSLDPAGNLLVVDISQASDSLTIQSDTASRRFVISDPTKTFTTTLRTVVGNNTHRITVPFDLVTGRVVLAMREGADEVQVDYSLGNFEAEIVYAASDEASELGDALELSGGQILSGAVFNFTDRHSGTIDLAGNALIYHSHTESISSTLDVLDLTLNYGESRQAISISGAGASAVVRSTEAARAAFSMPGRNLTFNGGEIGANAVHVDGRLELDGGSLNVLADEIIVTGSVSAIGGGSVSFNAARSVAIQNASRIQTVDGDIRIIANMRSTQLGGDFSGVRIDQRSSISTQQGDILLAGRSGQGWSNHGVHLTGAALVESTGTGSSAGKISVIGFSGTESVNLAVAMSTVGTTLRSIDGDIEISGHGGAQGAGIRLSAGVIQSTGVGSEAGRIRLHGMTGNDSFWAVKLQGEDSIITSVDGEITVVGEGVASNTRNNSVHLDRGAIVQSTGSAAPAASITIQAMGAAEGLNTIRLDAQGTAVTSHSGDIHFTGASVWISTGAVVSSHGRGDAAASITIDRGQGTYIDRAQLITVDGPIQILDGLSMWNSSVISSVGRGDIRIGGEVVSMSRRALISSTATGDNAGRILIHGTAQVGLHMSDSDLTSIDGDIEILGESVSLRSGSIESTGRGSNAASITIEVNDTAALSTSLRSIDGSIRVSGRRVSGGGFTSTGTGSDAAAISIRGSGGGVQVGGVTSDSGPVEIVGSNLAARGAGVRVGRVAAAGPIKITGRSADAWGIDLYRSTISSNGAGEIEIEGTGQGGVRLDDTRIVSVDADLRISGNTETNSRSGVDVRGGSEISAAGAGAIEIVSTAGGPSEIYLGDAVIVGDPVGIGDLTLRADSISVNQAAQIRGSGSLLITPNVAATSIGLGDGRGTLQLDHAELARIAAGFHSVTIGDIEEGTGPVDIAGSTFKAPLTIVGGSIFVDGLDAGDNTVTLQARTGQVMTAAGLAVRPSVIGAAVSVHGDLSPAGQFQVDGDFVFDSSASYTVDLNGTTAGTRFDQLQLIGASRVGSLNSAALQVDLGFEPAIGTTFKIVDMVDSNSRLEGRFAGLEQHATLAVDGQYFRVDYHGGTGANDVVLTVIPAPSALVDAQLLDIRKSPYSLRELTPIGSTVFFVSDSVYGQELWKSDGTSAGTVLVKDISPGPTGSNPRLLTVVGGTLFFWADDGIHGSELWMSDGTAAGTVLVKDLALGSAGSDPDSLTNVDGTLMFAADDGIHGTELWSSDGTSAGTVIVQDIFPGANGSDPDTLTVVAGMLFFSASDGVHGNELWRLDAGSYEPRLVRDLAPGPEDGSPRMLTRVGDALFFSGRDGVHGSELWKSDGTREGTVVVRDRVPGSELSLSYGSFTAVDGTLFFVARTADGHRELWRSDGSGPGTVAVKRVNASALTLTDVEGVLFFRASDESIGSELWKSDGSEAGTAPVKDIFPGRVGSYPGSLTNFNGTLFFRADDGVHGAELWKTDGTGEGTVLVEDLHSGSSGSNPWSMLAVGSRLFFSAVLQDVGLFSSDGVSIRGPFSSFKSNGTSQAREFVASGDTTFFVAYGPRFRELWKTDGTAAGTMLLTENTRQTIPRYLTDVEGTLFYSSNGQQGRELWKSDGTSAGTMLIKDIHPSGSSEPELLTNVDGTLFFVASDGEHGRELWKSDGTKEGTALVTDLTPGPSGTYIESLTGAGGRLFFLSRDASHGRELWVSDGTQAGTVLVKDIRPGRSGSWPRHLTDVNGTLFFSANLNELWKSDGTSEGTVLVKRIGQRQPAFDYYASAVSANGTFYFTADDGIHGRELWRSDGTEAGTAMVKDIFPGGVGSVPAALTNLNGEVYFEARDGIHGTELWKSDGSVEGTILVSDTRPGPASSHPRWLTAVDHRLFYTADDGIHGEEIWMTNRTEVRTSLVADIRPGPETSRPRYLANAGGTLFFGADNGMTGWEPWFVDVVPQVVGQTINGAENGNRSRIDSLELQFSDDMFVGGTTDLHVFNHTVGESVEINGSAISNNGSSRITWEFSGIHFPDGVYTAELSKFGATNHRGRPLPANHTFLFRKLSGDADGDGQVGFADLVLLTRNFGTVDGPRLGPGDFDGDGNVDFRDFAILSENFNRTLPALQLDFGDAPEAGTSFPTVLSSNSPRHVLGSRLYLGAGVDGEIDGQASPAATGDGEDEDGVTFAALRAGSEAEIKVTATGGLLNAWMDFNSDGDWDDIGEQIIYERNLNNGTNELSISIPSAATTGPTFARFRLTGRPGYSYTGLAPSGEVEDYRVSIISSVTGGRQPDRHPANRTPADAHTLEDFPASTASQLLMFGPHLYLQKRTTAAHGLTDARKGQEIRFDPQSRLDFWPGSGASLSNPVHKSAASTQLAACGASAAVTRPLSPSSVDLLSCTGFLDSLQVELEIANPWRSCC